MAEQDIAVLEQTMQTTLRS